MPRNILANTVSALTPTTLAAESCAFAYVTGDDYEYALNLFFHPTPWRAFAFSAAYLFGYVKQDMVCPITRTGPIATATKGIERGAGQELHYGPVKKHFHEDSLNSFGGSLFFCSIDRFVRAVEDRCLR